MNENNYINKTPVFTSTYTYPDSKDEVIRYLLKRIADLEAELLQAKQ